MHNHWFTDNLLNSIKYIQYFHQLLINYISYKSMQFYRGNHTYTAADEQIREEEPQEEYYLTAFRFGRVSFGIWITDLNKHRGNFVLTECWLRAK